MQETANRLGVLCAVLAIFTLIAQPPAYANPYKSLRSRLFSSDPVALGIKRFSPKSQAWGVVMEMGMPRGTATFLALSDGTTSMYFETGSAVIGGGENRHVARAAINLVAVSDRYRAHFKPTSTFPQPRNGNVLFYQLTRTGRRISAQYSQAALSDGTHPLSVFYVECHRVLALIRQLQQKLEGG